MKVTVKVSPHRAQLIAALVEFWDIYDSEDQDIECNFAIEMLPKLLWHLSFELSSIPFFFDNLASYAETHHWTQEECALLRSIKNDEAAQDANTEALRDAADAESADEEDEEGQPATITTAMVQYL